MCIAAEIDGLGVVHQLFCVCVGGDGRFALTTIQEVRADPAGLTMAHSIASTVTIVVALVAAVANSVTARQVYDFESFVSKYGKSYATSLERENRRAIYERNAAAVAAHNELADSGAVTWYHSINSFSDWTEAELANLRGYDRALGYHQLNQQAVYF